MEDRKPPPTTDTHPSRQHIMNINHHFLYRTSLCFVRKSAPGGEAALVFIYYYFNLRRGDSNSPSKEQSRQVRLRWVAELVELHRIYYRRLARSRRMAWGRERTYRCRAYSIWRRAQTVRREFGSFGTLKL